MVLESQKAEIQFNLERFPLKIKLDFVSLPTGSDFGTADALKQMKDKYVILYKIHSYFLRILTYISLYFVSELKTKMTF